MLYIVALATILILLVLFRRSYQQYASGLREQPGYFLWFVTRIIHCTGWSSEEYCLRTDEFKPTGRPGYLNEKDLPARNRSRPKMLRAVPHRQLSQQAPDDIMYELDKYMASISIPRYGGETLNNDLLLRGKSVVEYTGADALFLPNANQTTFDKGEIAHLHSNDGSFHMKLHPSDAKLVIEKQWAERFPLAGLNFGRIQLPPTYLLVYAPQNADDINVWKTILHAAISYARDNRSKY